jgi:hypothetical protein
LDRRLGVVKASNVIKRYGIACKSRISFSIFSDEFLIKSLERFWQIVIIGPSSRRSATKDEGFVSPTGPRLPLPSLVFFGGLDLRSRNSVFWFAVIASFEGWLVEG